LGGAVGDALGAPVEFQSFAEIQSQFGSGGIREFSPAYGRIGAITDDTQMTLFTAEGLLRAQARWNNKGICHLPSVVHHAYMRWLKTQGETPANLNFPVKMDGWLVKESSLWSSRAPGMTCLEALRGSRRLGDPASNDSKGCGGIMRAAPVGLAVRREAAFKTGCNIAALTHGHPSGSLSAGFLALLIAEIVAGTSLLEATAVAKLSLVSYAEHEEVLSAVEMAESLAASKANGSASTRELGEGWVAEEALAIALFCALAGRDLEDAVVMAVNHSGDSDSTGAIAGNICGALYGVESVPAKWMEPLELRVAITMLADDLLALAEGSFDASEGETWERYPGT
jgi:ADP-ribosylglycohydrolase